MKRCLRSSISNIAHCLVDAFLYQPPAHIVDWSRWIEILRVWRPQVGPIISGGFRHNNDNNNSELTKSVFCKKPQSHWMCYSRRRRGKISDGVWRSREREVNVCEIDSKWVPDGWASVRECACLVCGQSGTGKVQVVAISWAPGTPETVDTVTTGVILCRHLNTSSDTKYEPANVTRLAGTDAAHDRTCVCSIWFWPVSYTHLTLPTNREV